MSTFFFDQLKPGQQWGSIYLQVGDVLLNNMTLIMIHMEQEGKPLDKKCPIDIFGHCSNKFGPYTPLVKQYPWALMGPIYHFLK